MPVRTGQKQPHIRPATASLTIPARLDMRARLRAATATANSEILTGIRGIVQDQVARMAALSREGAFGPAQAGALHRLAQTYTLLAQGTEKEQSKYDLTSVDSTELEQLEAAAKEILGEDGT